MICAKNSRLEPFYRIPFNVGLHLFWLVNSVGVVSSHDVAVGELCLQKWWHIINILVAHCWHINCWWHIGRISHQETPTLSQAAVVTSGLSWTSGQRCPVISHNSLLPSFHQQSHGQLFVLLQQSHSVLSVLLSDHVGV